MANIKQITLDNTTYAIVPEKLGTATVGAPNRPIYLNAGTPTEASAYPTTLPASDVSSWAKAASKPTYTASEVGAYSKSEIDTKIGNVESSLDAINTMLKNMI